MRTLLADLVAKAGDVGALGALERWLLRRENVIRYAIAPVAVAIALAARSLLTPILPEEAPYIFFVPAVLVAAGLGGLGPGLVATLLGTLLGLLLVEDYPSYSPPEIVNAVLFGLIGTGIAWS